LAAPPSFYLDECFAHQIGDALALVNYPVITPEAAGKVGALDPELFPWLAEQGHVWITRDDASKRQHRHQVIREQISILWVRGLAHKEGRSITSVERAIDMREVFILLATQIPKLEATLAKARGRVDFLLYFSGDRPTHRLIRPFEGDTGLRKARRRDSR
jgi:hypothetical protein